MPRVSGVRPGGAGSSEGARLRQRQASTMVAAVIVSHSKSRMVRSRWDTCSSGVL